MGQTANKKKKTDYGTVIFHWLLVAALALAVLTGLRIATETPDRGWINVLDLVLPSAAVWTHHIDAAVLLIGISVAYVVYMALAGLGQRVRLDGVRLRGLFGRRYARWGTINIVLYWIFYSVMLSQLLTGVLLYIGHTSYFIVQAHWFGMWIILCYGALHVFSQWQFGGAAQLMRILHPARLKAPPPPFDPVEVLALLDERANAPLAPRRAQPEETRHFQRKLDRHSPATDKHRDPNVYSIANDERSSNWLPDHEKPPGRRRHRGPVIQANPFIVASAAAAVGVTFMLAVERRTADTLYIHRVDPTEMPVVDGEASDPIWRKIPPITVVTERGGNFQGSGETTVSIQAVHDGTYAFFLFVWDDPTRSLKQLPLKKTAKGWQLLHDGYEHGDERAYNEDKFSILLTTLDAVLAGDLTFHAGPAPAADKPHTLSGRGLHYTMSEGVFADVWQWKATSTNPSSFCDDYHFGPPAEATKAQYDGLAPYRGGFAADPGVANYQYNFPQLWPQGYEQAIIPHRLPKVLATTAAALGRIDLDPDHGENEGARWYMTEGESVPYSAELDRQIPEGTVIPGVIISGQYSGDRADVRCAARWGAGRWALEVVRRLEVQGPYDVPIRTGTFMRVAAFDHAQIQHTRHVRPIRLEVK